MAHYDDEALFQYAEGTSPIAGEIESHVSACERCSSEIGSHREIVEALQTDTTWNDPAPAPRQFVVDVASFAEKARQEDEHAAALCDDVLSGPPAWWRQRLRKAENVYTAGMVRQLLDRMRQLINSSPANALQVTAMAIEIANALDIAAYPCDYVIKLRAQACRDHAYVLAFMGRNVEAIDFADRSKRLFDQVPMPEYDLARLALVKANILRWVDRVEEAIVLTREAAETFLRFGDAPRYINARITEGVMLYVSGAVEKALAVWSSLENHPALEPSSAPLLSLNIANCYGDLHQPERAVEYLQRCIPEFEMLGMETERTRSRWTLGRMLMTAGKLHDAAPILRTSWREFEQLELVGDAALAALDLAETLLTVGETEEVPAICRDVITRFTSAGMASRALTALSFLREAVAIGQATPVLVRHVSAFLRELPAEQPRLFAPPPAGMGE